VPERTQPTTPATQPAQHTFQVNLRGLVDLLSHHLYSSPRVYVRELLQNAIDAITARRQLDPAAPAWVRVTVDGDGLRVDDPGIGLTPDDVHKFLATIGSSTKRDEVAGIESARREFLGQFGIGLLACFVVADEIRVITRSAAHRDAPTVEWRATSDGAYTVAELDQPREEPGTTVTLRARPGAERWFTPERVTQLAGAFGALLPYDVTVDAGATSTTVNQIPPVWKRRYRTPDARAEALIAHGKQALGFTALDVIDLDVPAAGVHGVAYVLPVPASPLDRGGHRVYLKGMLLSESAERLLPDWAFFARCVVDTEAVRPTASREALYDDETLGAIRDALGDRIRDWLAELAAGDPARLARFLAVHQSASRRSPATTRRCCASCCPGCRSRPPTDRSASPSSSARTPSCTWPARWRSSARSPRSRRRRGWAWSTVATPTTPTSSSGCRRWCRARASSRSRPTPWSRTSTWSTPRRSWRCRPSCPRRGPPGRHGLRRGAARLPPGVGAGALPGQPRRADRAGAGADRGGGRPVVGGDPVEPALDGRRGRNSCSTTSARWCDGWPPCPSRNSSAPPSRRCTGRRC
jgi:hypothetical protein